MAFEAGSTSMRAFPYSFHPRESQTSCYEHIQAAFSNTSEKELIASIKPLSTPTPRGKPHGTRRNLQDHLQPLHETPPETSYKTHSQPSDSAAAKPVAR